jgi:hypothetical protein
MASKADTTPPPTAPTHPTLEVERLLRRYPDLRRDELHRLIHGFARLPMVDVALMTADEQLSRRLDAFHRDHGKKHRLGPGALIAFIALPGLLLAGLLWGIFS